MTPDRSEKEIFFLCVFFGSCLTRVEQLCGFARSYEKMTQLRDDCRG